jgi:hypothetical protein
MNKKIKDDEQYCSDIEWVIGYIIGKSVSFTVNICIHIVNHTVNGVKREFFNKK